MQYEFPFTMKDVCGLVNYTYRRPSGDSIYVDCPACFSRKKGKLNINFSKNNFRCNRCGVSGGMLDFYILFGNPSLNRSEARAEIIDRLKTGDTVPSTSKFTLIKEVKHLSHANLAKASDINNTYNVLLSLLPIYGRHANELLRRGFSREQICEFKFKSVPSQKNIHQYISQLSAKGCVMKGVPGFYIGSDGKLTMNFSEYCKGIIVPTTGLDGNIHALQIRLDYSFEDGTKYIWFSSVSKKEGVSSGSPLNIAGNPYSEVIYLTEGGLKSMAAHAMSGRTFIGNQGANHFCALETALKALKQNGAKTIVVAYDNDKYDKIEVNEGYANTINMIKELGLHFELITWNSEYKGIDDFLLAQKNRKKLSAAYIDAA